jgi:glycosyltransferase involved in cell wall biosynthesis
MFFIQTILRDSGYRSEIFCGHVEPRFAGHIRPINDYRDRADDLLLVHYSLGTLYEAWIEDRKTPRVLIYHNITPAHFFPKGSELHGLAQSGRARLAAWARQGVFAGAIADSAFNAAELLASGYSSVAAIPLLVDLDRIRQAPWNEELSEQLAGARNLLFVGRLCEHKGQLDLVEMLTQLTRMCASPVRLILVGDTTSRDYQNAVAEEIERCGLGDRVLMLGRRDDEDVYALYRCCDLYCSMSQHEGFGMPLVESMAFDLPVLACAAGAVSATLASGGLVLDNCDPDSFAGAARLLLEEPWLRREVILGQRRALGQYERSPLVRELQNHLRRIGFDVNLRESRGTPSPRVWSIEGPFDSSYSLSLVNRELARGLSRAGETVDLVSRDGPGPFEPNQRFLAKDTEVRDMWRAGKASGVIDVNLRNLYPPSVADMRGALRGLAIYAWEESGFPERYVVEFNSTLNLITVASRFVAKVLRDNGVHAPIRVVGEGCDHVLDTAASDLTAGLEARPFRFLHVSSCFPRKAVDVLLAAWAKAFCDADPVELVIKTFPNAHNHIEDILAAIKTAHPRHAPIRLINRDVELEELRRLYLDAHAVVCASRGEGFGLPLVEALALGKPVIATAYGGQMDFCTPQSAWLCDYSFAYARTHLAVVSSVWTEPDVDSLVRALKECFSAPEERMRRAQAGCALVRSQFSWAQVAERTRRAVEQVGRLPASVLRLPKIGLVSTWNSRCGIAAYSKWLVGEIAPEKLVVFADRTATLVEPDEEFVNRSWTQGFADPLDDLYEAISTAAVDAVVVQFNLGFFRLPALAALIDRLVDGGILVFVCLHSTVDVEKPDLTIRLQEAKSSLARACRLLVHSVHDLNRLKTLGLVDNVTLFPQGAPTPVTVDRRQVRRDLRLTGNPVLATFGYLLPHKGLRELIRAFALIKRRQPQAHLLMLNALYPVPQSAEEHQSCLTEIEAHGLENCVTLTTDYLPDHDVLARLQAADVVVFPYQHTQESASAAVRLGLASLVPVACTPLPIFDDVSNATYQLSGITPEAIAGGITTLLSDKTLRSELAAKQKAWLAAHAWPALSRRLMGLIRGEFVDRCVTETSRNQAPVGSAAVPQS